MHWDTFLQWRYDKFKANAAFSIFYMAYNQTRPESIAGSLLGEREQLFTMRLTESCKTRWRPSWLFNGPNLSIPWMKISNLSIHWVFHKNMEVDQLSSGSSIWWATPKRYDGIPILCSITCIYFTILTPPHTHSPNFQQPTAQLTKAVFLKLSEKGPSDKNFLLSCGKCFPLYCKTTLSHLLFYEIHPHQEMASMIQQLVSSEERTTC